MGEKRHVIGGTDGWLKVRREPSGQIIALPEYLHVEFSHNKDGRDFFEAVEGSEQGKIFSVRQGNLRRGLPAYKPAARLEFNVTMQKLSFPGGDIRAITADGAAAVPLGTHPVQIPDSRTSLVQAMSARVNTRRTGSTWGEVPRFRGTMIATFTRGV
jgi:hypothetical protein